MPILVVSSAPESHTFLAGLADEAGWGIVSAYDFRGFVALYRTRRFAVVICEDNLPDGAWTDVLEALEDQGSALLIVTALHADERLWTEVLHRGGYDVLAQPFDRAEARRVVASCRGFHYRATQPQVALKKSA